MLDVAGLRSPVCSAAANVVDIGRRCPPLPERWCWATCI
ncbi:Hypothetical protein A7982_00345 [Minicystis rosea]|nr:Hypothetical protein A7982_00345 [Minicystis rosea]